MKRLLALALAASLSACSATTGVVPVNAAPVVARPTPIERAAVAFDLAEASYARIRAWSVRLEPYLPGIWRDRLIMARTIADQAMAAARAARTLAEQAEALRRLDAASRSLAAAGNYSVR